MENNRARQIKASEWSDEGVPNLAAYQSCEEVHPFTGPNANGETVKLIPAKLGWTTEPGRPVVQTWAYDLMLDGSAVETFQRQREMVLDRSTASIAYKIPR